MLRCSILAGEPIRPACTQALRLTGILDWCSQGEPGDVVDWVGSALPGAGRGATRKPAQNIFWGIMPAISTIATITFESRVDAAAFPRNRA